MAIKTIKQNKKLGSPQQLKENHKMTRQTITNKNTKLERKPKQIDSTDERRMFGYYKCSECERKWQSGNSWKGFAQKCTKCMKRIMAYRYEDLQSGKSLKKSEKPHPSNLCMKCKQLGYCCQFSFK